MAEEPSTAAVNELAQELGWQGTPQGGDAEALALLLDDEFERLDGPPRKSFAERLRSAIPDQLGRGVLVCPQCLHCCLGRYQPDDGRCRVCAGDLQVWGEGGGRPEGWDSDFGFVLDTYGAKSEAELLNPAGGNDLAQAWDLAGDRKLARAIQFADDNKDWDDLQDEIKARRERLEAERKAKAEAAEAARKAKAEAARKAKEEAERKAKEAAERKAREEAARKAKEEAERKAKEEAERKAREEAERKRLAELEKHRPALGCVIGEKAGEPIRIPDLPEARDTDETAVYVVGWPKKPLAMLYVGKTPATVDGKPVDGEVELEMGALVTIGDERAYVVEETMELGSQVAETIHFARDDKKPGGPWPYWNEQILIGAKLECAVNVVDDGVADVHATVQTRFGVVTLEDSSGSAADDGVFVGKKRKKALILVPDLVFTLGPKGPPLKVGAGEAKQKKSEKARAMKPSRHKRTVFEIRNDKNQLIRKVFVFTRREVRFGNRAYSSQDETRMINELTLIPSSREQAEIAEKQGGLGLTRDGVELRRDGGAEMLLNDEPLEPGKAVDLKRRFKLKIGEGLEIDGRVYRSPSAVERTPGPARLGMKGGHPFECVRLDRRKTPHTYVFLVRMLRIGSEPFAPLRLTLPGVEQHHCQIMFSQGKFLIVAPKENAPVFLGDVEMDPGVAFPLEIDTTIKVGSCSLHFRVVDDGDFLL